MKRHNNDNRAPLLTMERVLADRIPERRLRDVAKHNARQASVAASAGRTTDAARLKRQADNLVALANALASDEWMAAA